MQFLPSLQKQIRILFLYEKRLISVLKAIKLKVSENMKQSQKLKGKKRKEMERNKKKTDSINIYKCHENQVFISLRPSAQIQVLKVKDHVNELKDKKRTSKQTDTCTFNLQSNST